MVVIVVGACSGKLESSAEPAEGDGGSSARGGRTGAPPSAAGISNDAAGAAGAAGEPHAPGTPDDSCAGHLPCAGCTQDELTVVCSRTRLPETLRPPDVDLFRPQEACAEAQRVAEALKEGAGGAGGAVGADPGGSAGVGGEGGVSLPDACETYVLPDERILTCGGCVESVFFEKRGSCVIDGECCVITGQYVCGP